MPVFVPAVLRRVRQSSRLLVASTLLLLLSACASVPEQTAHAAEVDPWEGLNRQVFAFNEVADKYVLRPVAVGYQAAAPEPVERGVSNFFNNLRDVNTLINELLQGKPGDGVVTLYRILINSSVGLAGLIDVATPLGFERTQEDFGQTLATWGVGDGPYLVLPFYGPSNIRDAGGLVLDTLALPITYISDDDVRIGLQALNIIDTRAQLISGESLISGDKYSFMRDAWMQQREYKIKDGEIVIDDAGFGGGDFEDFDDF